MGEHLRKEVLRAFKTLHRTRLSVFQGDPKALAAARERINNEFRKNRTIEDDVAIKEMVVYAKEVDDELRTTVVQAEEKKDGVYALRITPETKKLDNLPFDPNVEIPKRGKSGRPCVQ